MTDVKLNGATSSALAFDYDQLSRRTKLTYDNGVETDYGLEWDNDLNSLIQTFNGSSVEFTYGFNSVHELTSQAVDDATFMWHPASGGTVSYGTANSMNQYPSVGGNSFTYDDNGCLTDDGVWDFGYDTENRLVSADDGTTSASYLYDPSGRQAQKEVNTTKTRYIHAGIRIIAEYDGSDTFVKRYVHGPGLDEVLLEIDSSNDVTYLHHDRLGSIIATTDDTGAVIDTYAYSPWGESGSMSGTTFGFTGQRYDAETGLYFYKNRHYSPEVGRFLQPDPIGYGDGLNMYQYGYNNPNSFTDPLGLAADGSSMGSDTGAGAISQSALLHHLNVFTAQRLNWDNQYVFIIYGIDRAVELARTFSRILVDTFGIEAGGYIRHFPNSTNDPAVFEIYVKLGGSRHYSPYPEQPGQVFSFHHHPDTGDYNGALISEEDVFHATSDSLVFTYGDRYIWPGTDRPVPNVVWIHPGGTATQTFANSFTFQYYPIQSVILARSSTFPLEWALINDLLNPNDPWYPLTGPSEIKVFPIDPNMPPKVK